MAGISGSETVNDRNKDIENIEFKSELIESDEENIGREDIDPLNTNQESQITSVGREVILKLEQDPLANVGTVKEEMIEFEEQIDIKPEFKLEPIDITEVTVVVKEDIDLLATEQESQDIVRKRKRENKDDRIRYACDECNLSCNNFSYLKLHKKSKHGGIRYPCDLCEYAAVDLCDIREHKGSKHKVISAQFKAEKIVGGDQIKAEDINTDQESAEYADVDPVKTDQESEGIEDRDIGKEYIELKLEPTDIVEATIAEEEDVDPLDIDQISKENNAYDEFSLKRHKIQDHEEIRYSCDQCEYSCTQPFPLKWHIKSEHERKIYPCDQCEYVGFGPTGLRKHKKSEHLGIRYPCNKCDYVASHMSHLRRHLSIHEWNKYPCDQCEFTASLLVNLNKHKEFKHNMIT